MCDWHDIGCHFQEGAKAFAETAFDTILEWMSDAVVEALGQIIESLGTLWVHVSPPPLTGATGDSASISAGETGDTSGSITRLLEYGVWIALGVCVLSLIALGARMAIARRQGEGGEHLGKVGMVLGAVVLISAASGIIMTLIPTTAAPSGSGPTVYLQNSLWWYTGAAAVMSVVVAGTKMAWEQRAEPGKDLIKSLITLVIVSAGGVTMANLAITASEQFSTWILDNATDGTDFAENVSVMLVMSGASGVISPIIPLTVILLGLFAIIATMMQIVLMVVRIGMLVILAGVLPLAASFTNTEMGKSWFKKLVGWLVAFILYKPAAAIIYAAAFQLVGADLFEDDHGLLQVISGLTLMIVALIAMPALIRFAVPMVGGMAGGAAAGAAVSGAVADLPSGAAKTSGGGGGGGSGGGGGGGGGSGGGGSGGGGAGSGPTGSANTSGAAQGGGQMAGGAAKGGAAAGAGAATAGVATAAMAAADAAKKVGDTVAQTAKDATEGSESGEGGGPSGSR